MKLSVIIPSYNEEGNVKGIYDSLSKTLKDISYELIYIDDGSKDKTLEELEKVYTKDKKHVKVISFSRNFKKEAAIYAGLSHSSGEYTCIIDGDMQQNPKYLLEMLDFLEDNEDYEQVAMVMKKRKVDNFIMKISKKAFYFIIDKISDISFVSGASDFRMFRKCVKDSVLSLTEKRRFSKGIFSWIGFNTKYMEYEVEPRVNGKSSFNFFNSLNYAIDGILGYSTKPLRFATYVGLLSCIISIIYAIIIIASSLSSYAWIIFVILLLGGLELISIGILGEYLAKTYVEVKNRPVYIIRKSLGFDKK